MRRHTRQNKKGMKVVYCLSDKIQKNYYEIRQKNNVVYVTNMVCQNYLMLLILYVRENDGE